MPTPNTPAKHTPEPWVHWSKDVEIDVGNGDGPVKVHEIQGHYNEATGDGGVIGYAFTEPDARLIAAAPELLAELTHVLPLLDSIAENFMTDDGGLGAVAKRDAAKLRSALAKAQPGA